MSNALAPRPRLAPNEALQAAERLHDARPWSDMDASLRAALTRRADRLHTLQGLGTLAARQGHLHEAVLWFEAAVAAHPEHASAHAELAIALRRLGHIDEATAHFELAATLAPQDAHMHLLARLHRGTTLDAHGRTQDALACFEEAVQKHPDSADAWASLGMVQRHLHGAVAAEASFQRALRIEPARVDVIEQFALGLHEQRRYEDAALAYERLLQLAPQHPLAAGRLLHAKMLNADWTALGALQQRVEVALAAGHLAAEPFGLQAICTSPALLHRAARLYAATYHPQRDNMLPPATPHHGPKHGPKIRIGYVSGEFRNQATSMLLTEVLELHDRERFEVYAFDNGWNDASPLRQRIEDAVTELVPIREQPTLSAAEAVRARRIDVLVDLNGYFGQARTDLFSMRPAPVQASYLGFPGTTGAPYIDYLIADATVVPLEHHGFYAEKVVTLPDAYQPNDRQRRVGATPARRADIGLPDDAFVFCCMNNVYKITPAMFEVWMRLLRQVPCAVLLLYSDAEGAQHNLRTEAAARGIDPSRLHFGAPLPTEQHLARLRLADLFLDTWPYNAHTTASDALWAGLPLLTCTGPTFPGRVATSLLKAVGLPELVTDSFEAYEALAVRLATEPGHLKALRHRLAEQLRHAPLFDTPRHARLLEQAFSKMVDRARAGLAPATFSCGIER